MKKNTLAPIKIHLADDHNILREGMANLIRKNSNWQIVSESSNGPSTIDAVTKSKPEVILMDISMPGIDGIRVTRELVQSFPQLKIIALTVHAEKYYVLKMFEAGASGYLLKNCLFDELAMALRTVIQGRKYISPDVADKFLAERLKKDGEFDVSLLKNIAITERELEILRFLVEGENVKEIALQLNLSVKTIETHRKNIYSKLEIDNLPALTKFALREGYISLNE